MKKLKNKVKKLYNTAKALLSLGMLIVKYVFETRIKPNSKPNLYVVQ